MATSPDAMDLTAALVRAIEEGDLPTVRSLYAPDVADIADIYLDGGLTPPWFVVRIFGYFINFTIVQKRSAST
jgi:hypothetical protein